MNWNEFLKPHKVPLKFLSIVFTVNFTMYYKQWAKYSFFYHLCIPVLQYACIVESRVGVLDVTADVYLPC